MNNPPIRTMNSTLNQASLPRDIRRFKSVDENSQDRTKFVLIIKSKLDCIENNKHNYTIMVDKINELFDILDTRYGRKFMKTFPRFAGVVHEREQVFLDGLNSESGERENYIKKNMNWNLIHKVCLYAFTCFSH